ncbi:MAG: DUF2695 domain-containing protein [Alphaproteobacteria bacterium]|nr:DUF2695 domain-containing protein [Alphaproteobacteria bacterium]
MDKAEKKRLKAEFKRKEREALRASIPMPLDELKGVFRYVARKSAPPCDHTLKDTLHYLKTHNLDPDTIVPWLHEHGGYCDCEVIFNVHDKVGDIVGWDIG